MRRSFRRVLAFSPQEYRFRFMPKGGK